MSTPVWQWLPGCTEPVLVAELSRLPAAGGARWVYAPGYSERADTLAPDPVHLRLTRSSRGLPLTASDGLPGVLRDAAPAGYGADRLDAAAGRTLAPLERLELGPADGVGALEACRDVERKLTWRPHDLDDLAVLAAGLAEQAPASRAVRQLLDDAATSAGGERPKVTVRDGHRWWLAKMADRGDLPDLPAKEFVTMRLLAQLNGQPDIRTPEVRLVRCGAHAVYLIERFDRMVSAGHPAAAPTRRAYASAHTVLGLNLEALAGDVRRSYLVFADEMARWMRGSPFALADRQELWRRMAANALLGNVDDHPRNHGLLWQDGGWRLCPAFDVTPVAQQAPVVLRMALHLDGAAEASVERLLQSAPHFGVEIGAAADWLGRKSNFIAEQFEAELRAVGVPELGIAAVRCAYCMALGIATAPDGVKDAAARVADQAAKRQRRGARFSR